MIESIREIKGEISTERRYYIGSVPAEAQRVAYSVRKHWGVENQLHWLTDVAFNEDQCRTRIGDSAQNFATIRRIALHLIKKDSARKAGVKASRFKAGIDDTYRARLLGFV